MMPFLFPAVPCFRFFAGAFPCGGSGSCSRALGGITGAGSSAAGAGSSAAGACFAAFLFVRGLFFSVSFFSTARGKLTIGSFLGSTARLAGQEAIGFFSTLVRRIGASTAGLTNGGGGVSSSSVSSSSPSFL
jgi:hypothetical protein